MASISTHVLDASIGAPAASVVVRLDRHDGDTWVSLHRTSTDADGRCPDLGDVGGIALGDYRLTFGTGVYFDDRHVETFYPSVELIFRVTDTEGHYHVPLLLSPFAYSTYRGS